MGVTGIQQISGTANIKVVSALPTDPTGYYVDDNTQYTWQGGEIVYHSNDNRIYIQTATSGQTAAWKRLLEQLATSTTSTSTSTSSSSSSTSTSSSSTTTAE